MCDPARQKRQEGQDAEQDELPAHEPQEQCSMERWGQGTAQRGGDSREGVGVHGWHSLYGLLGECPAICILVQVDLGHAVMQDPPVLVSTVLVVGIRRDLVEVDVEATGIKNLLEVERGCLHVLAGRETLGRSTRVPFAAGLQVV